MRHNTLQFARVASALCLGGTTLAVQPAASACPGPLCVSRTDDSPADPQPGMLRYAIRAAGNGAVITFDRSLSGKTIELDRSSSGNHLRISRNISIEGPGPDLLTIDGGNATRIFFITADVVRISGLTLARGYARGGDGSVGSGGAGGGGGAAGLGGAIFLNRGSLILNGVVMAGNRCAGGNRGGGGSGVGYGRGGGGGGLGGRQPQARRRWCWRRVGIE